MAIYSRRIPTLVSFSVAVAALAACNTQSLGQQGETVAQGQAALNETVPTPLWMQRVDQENSPLEEYDIMTDTLTSSCVPAGATVPPNKFGFGDGVAHDPTDNTLWYTVANADAQSDWGFGDSLGAIHHMSPPPACAELAPIIVGGDGPGGAIQDDMGAMDIDPDDGNLWVNGSTPFGDTIYHAFYKVNKTTGAIMQSCKVFPLSSNVRGNDAIAIARLPGLSGSGKYILSDVAPDIFTGGPAGVTLHVKLGVFDTAACTGGLNVEVLPVTTYTLPLPVAIPEGDPTGITGIDFEKGKLIGIAYVYPSLSQSAYLVDYGAPPFATVQATMPIPGLPSLGALDISLRGNVNRPPVAVCKDVTATNVCQATASIDNGSYDPDGGTVNCTQSPTGPFSPGATTVTLTCTDSGGAVSTCSSTVTVTETIPPVFTSVPAPITTTMCGSINIGQATASDNCAGVTVTNDRPAQFPPGATTVTWTAKDAAGNVTTATQLVTVILTNNSACCPAGSNIIVGTSNNDNLNGTAGSDCIIGLGAQDTINGQGGNDYISGGDGDDIIRAGTGNDVVFGGTGQDQIYGEAGNDILYGDDGVDKCWGGDGDDVLYGGQGQDDLRGENGNDKLFGNADDDRLDGGPGNDALDGGGLHDVCIGGPDVDTFSVCQTQIQ